MIKGIITLCGSTKFKKEFDYWNSRLTLGGWIVLAPGAFGHVESDEYISNLISENKYALDNMHLIKIGMSRAIFVVNKDGYIGKSTANEISHALKLKKEVFYMSNMGTDSKQSDYLLR